MDLPPLDNGVDGAVRYDNTFHPLEGDLEEFWTMEHLSDPEIYLGVNHLLGERPFPDAMTEVYGMRCPQGGKLSMNLNYHSTMSVLG